MQSETRTQAPTPRDFDIILTQRVLETTLVAAVTSTVAPPSQPLAKRFGPLPGEIYADEAHFGSFT